MHYREALKVQPGLPGLHFQLGEALNESASESAKEQAEIEFKAAISENPLDAESECRLGEFAYGRSDLQNALAHYSRAVELNPNSADANFGMAKVLIEMGQIQKAEPSLTKAARLEPFDARIHYRLGSLYREMGRTADADREFASFRSVKAMKEQLAKTYEEMRLRFAKAERPDPTVPK
jgi:tetratricopeptide (TPR) repeat protein